MGAERAAFSVKSAALGPGQSRVKMGLTAGTNCPPVRSSPGGFRHRAERSKNELRQSYGAATVLPFTITLIGPAPPLAFLIARVEPAEIGMPTNPPS